MSEDIVQPQEPEPNSLDYIQAEVRKYQEALRQEFEMMKSDDIANIKEKVKERFASKLLTFVDTIIEISQDAESDGTRLAAAKFGLNFVLGDVVEKPEDDPMTKLINGLLKKTVQENEKEKKKSTSIQEDE
jgi:hypothetical protein